MRVVHRAVDPEDPDAVAAFAEGTLFVKEHLDGEGMPAGMTIMYKGPPGYDPESRLAKTNQQIAWTRYRIQEMHQLIAATESSPLADLKREADAARAVGKNFIVEMRKQVLHELEEAEADLAKVEDALASLDGEVVKIIRSNSHL